MNKNDIEKSVTLTEYQKLAQAFPPLERHEEAILADKCSRGDRNAQEKLFKHNSARILFFALERGKPESRRVSHKSHAAMWPSHDEVASWGAEGLWWAVTHFHRGRIPFNQWANLCVRTFIWRMKVAQDRKEIKQLNIARDLSTLYEGGEFIPPSDLDIEGLLSAVAEHCSPELVDRLQGLLGDEICLPHDEHVLTEIREQLRDALGEIGLQKLGLSLER